MVRLAALDGFYAFAQRMRLLAEELLGPWRQRVEELAIENGKLQERVGQLGRQVAELKAAHEREEQVTVGKAPVPARPWWRLW